MSFIGIDIGLKGGIAWLLDDGKVETWPMPVSEGVVDVAKLPLEHFALSEIVAIETITYNSRWSKKVLKSLSIQYGQICSAVSLIGAELQPVSPHVWQDEIFGPKKDRKGKNTKDLSIVFCEFAFNKKFKKSEDGQADALCIAEWVKRYRSES